MKIITRTRPFVLAIALAASASLVGAVSVFANFPLVSGVGSCNAQGQQIATWTVSNPEQAGGATMTITAVTLSSSPSLSGLSETGIKVGDVLGPQASETGTTIVPGNFYGSVTVNITASFSSGSSGGGNATVFFPGNCSAPPPPPPGTTAQFAPTNTTCQQFLSGSATTENVINYNLKNGSINNVSPGVLFYYTKISAPSSGGSFTVTISQTNNSTNGTPAFGTAQVLVYLGDCSSNYSNFSTSVSGGTLTITINGAAANQAFIISDKVDPHSVVGSTAPNPSTVTYTYTTSVNGTALSSSVQQANLEP